MRFPRRTFLKAAAGVLALPASPRIASAEAAYPSKPITIVVPYAAGGPTDTIARILAERMKDPLGQNVLVETVTGASGSLGVGRVVRAPPDGYTVSIGNWPTHVVNGAIMTLPYDLLKDLEPVTLLAANPYVVVARKDLPAETLPELIAWLKANSDKATEGTGGPGKLKPLPARKAKLAMVELMRDLAIEDVAFARGALPLLEEFLPSRGPSERAACLVAVTRIRHVHPELRRAGAEAAS